MWPLVSDNQIENLKKKTELGRALLCLSEKKKSHKRGSHKKIMENPSREVKINN